MAYITKKLLVTILGCAAALTAFAGLLIWNPNIELARVPQDGCYAFTSWMQRRQLIRSLQEPLSAGVDLTSDKEVLDSIGGDVLTWTRWPSDHHRTRFAAFSPHTLEQILSVPALQTSAFLLIVAGEGHPQRRRPHEPFISVAAPGPLSHPKVFNTSALYAALPVKTLNAAASVLESALLQGRRIHAFTLETATLPLCVTGTGACAVWHAGAENKILIDETLINKIASAPGVPHLTETFARILPQKLVDAATEANLMGLVESAEAVGAVVSRAATAAVAALFLSHQPLWWCLACPIALGLLAPLAINFGLTAAAEELCAILELSSTECSDLWWSAFALAMVLSLGAAVPIVYVCRLPDCVQRKVLPSAALQSSL